MKHKHALHSLPVAIIVMLGLTSLATAQTFDCHGPIVVDDNYIQQHGNVISDNFIGTLTEPAITIKTSTPVIIQNTTVMGPGDLIYTDRADVTVINTVGIGTNPNQLNVRKGMFLHAENALNVKVEHCTIEETRFGIYVHRYLGNYNHKQTIKVLNNIIKNIDGRPSNGNGGYITTIPENNAHAIQLNATPNIPDMEIAWNETINQPNLSQTSDVINIFSSGGTQDSHLLIHDNFVQGAYPTNPGTDWYSGGGIITDGTGTDSNATTTAYVDIYKNQMVSTANYGIAIAAGHDNSIYNNRVVSSGYLADGTFSTQRNAVGMYNWNHYNQSSLVFFNNHIYENLIGLISSDQNGRPFRNDWWLPGQYNLPENNRNWQPYDAGYPTVADEANEYQIWQRKLKMAHKVLGATLKTPSLQCQKR